jgi:hypothetical protein
MEMQMNSLPGAITTATRTSIALGLLVLAGGALAANTGSTDIYRNQFQESFGVAIRSNDSTHFADYRNGSTDIYRNRFQESFGSSEPGGQAQTACGTGSTDIWGNGFRKSFGDTSSASSGLIGLCEPVNGASHLR